jgi:tetratricopeptide (TPR) repeat protein
LPTADSVSAEAEKIQPASADVLLIRAQVKVATGKLGELPRYLDALESYVAKAPAADAGFALQVGELQRLAGRTALARANLQTALGTPKFEESALIGLVQLETAANEAAQAHTYLDRLKKKGADAAVVEQLEGDLVLSEGHLDSAASHYANAAANNSRGAATKLARVQERQGKGAAGIATLQAWVAANPSDYAAALELATMRIRAGDTERALKEYEVLLPHYSDTPMFLNNLAWLYFETKDPRAEAMARRAYAAAPDNPDVCDTLGWILVQSDGSSAAGEAVRLLEKSATQNQAPAVLYHLAVAQQKAGRTGEARRTVALALKVERFAERSDAEQLAKALGQ